MKENERKTKQKKKKNRKKGKKNKQKMKNKTKRITGLLGVMVANVLRCGAMTSRIEPAMGIGKQKPKTFLKHLKYKTKTKRISRVTAVMPRKGGEKKLVYGIPWRITGRKGTHMNDTTNSKIRNVARMAARLLLDRRVASATAATAATRVSATSIND
ncbi:hypothetical protein POVCU2_0031540 [Plasmodium ovale curtisi]|uniref:Uncharacterized protein n=1 Tax=Plasmodium ovale curtisi TaxID=864141 RepID=A0A1A8W0H9_PLAOA|nr:hypothetical protein POVCU2_0031540 [Plasmodium ovale curtisi]